MFGGLIEHKQRTSNLLYEIDNKINKFKNIQYIIDVLLFILIIILFFK